MLFSCLALTAIPASAAEKKEPKTELTAEQKARLDKIVNRVEEIRRMDKSKLSSEERKALRKELKEMKQEARVLNNGVYLSVGAIIIIILLLILLL
ncbi:hypothetical protein D9M68_490510 [compost metagenome]